MFRLHRDQRSDPVRFAADRTNQYLGDLCDPLTPAVLDAIGMAADGTRRRGMPMSICGELAGDPLGALLLLGLDVNALSMTPGGIGRVKQMIRTFSLGQARGLWRDALKEHSANGVRELLMQALDERGLGGLVKHGK